ncbi:MAG: tRNA(Ile)-lysidine synthetase [Sodalis sp. Psp]|nr:tRNA(Ile)-lysidine synthetase [Sodalis sp. Psp]MCR3757284.1 tRNA(Ile)-lysidine synthetase [Sodalis sp. Ppy]
MKLDTVSPIQILHRRVAVAILPYRSLLLAYSGGLDSTVLLDILTALRDDDNAEQFSNRKFSLRACYVHHGLSRHADRWAVHCARECYQRNVLFSTERTVLNSTADGIEAAARNARYQILAQGLKDDEVLLTAQHQDDQTETLLLALKRGSGPAGLAAMAANTPFYGRRLVRPLLGCSRSELAVYAREHQLRWIEDDSNDDLRFDRNFIRLRILPLLRQRWPQFAVAASRSAQLCAEQETLLNELLEETLATLILPDGSLRVAPLMSMSDARRAAILRRWLASRGARMPSRQKLTCLWQEVALSRRDAVAQLQLDDRLVRRFHGRLYVLPLPLPCKETVLPWPPADKKLTLPQGQGEVLRCLVSANSALLADYQKSVTASSDSKAIGLDDTSLITGMTVCTVHVTTPAAIVRAPLPGERVSIRFGLIRGLLHISGRRHGRKLKKLWRELDIPPWRRNITPLLFYNDTLIAALGAFVTREGEAKSSLTQWRLDWQQKPDGAITTIQGDK